MTSFPLLMSPLKLGPVTIRNRVVFTGHDTLLQKGGLISDEYIAYQVARTKGGCGVQMLSAAGIDGSSMTTPDQFMLHTDAVIPGLRRMADAIHAHGGVVFAQLLHAGREMYSAGDGTLPVTYSASATPTERYRVLPREMSREMIGRMIEAYAAAAKRVIEGGLDGVEMVGNGGNLPLQFLAADTNKRTDEYGGSLRNRMRFTIEACRAIRTVVGDRHAFGLRYNASDMDLGATEEESLALAQALDEEGLIDYLSVALGSPASRGGGLHAIPPMTEKVGYVAPYAERVKQRVRIPVIATGRFNTPQSAEEAIRKGQADAIGMTRGMITDPELGVKIRDGRIDDIRACIGCVQACIYHYQRGYSISCIQYPESGRELEYGAYPPIERRRRILVVGGGPAGMKAAVVAALRGHDVVLCEATAQLGGQVQLAERLPTRAEFGGLTTNLVRELELAGVEVRRNTPVDLEMIKREKPDAVVLATGGRTRPAGLDTIQDAHVVTADDVLRGANVGKRVVIADNRCDWTGIGVAEKLAAEGHHVRLVVTGIQPGEFIPLYVRDHSMGRLFKAGVEVTSYARLYGADGETAYFQHVVAHEPLVMEGVDTLVTCFGEEADLTLQDELAALGIEHHIIGDCLTPRTAEEAVFEGLKAGVAL